MKKIFKIKGMHCKSCAMLIKEELSDKVKSISVDAVSGEAVVEFDEKKISEDKIKEIVRGMDYQIN